MKGHWLLLGAMLLTAGMCPAQAAGAPAMADFAGTWTAEFHKQVWFTLTLAQENGTLSGTLTHSVQISADNEGDITKVDDEMTSDKVTQVELQGETLHIDVKDEDGNVDPYRMVLTGKDTAEIRPVTAEGTSAPRAFKLKRAPAAAPAAPAKK